MTNEQKLLDAVSRADNFDSVTLSVVLVEMHRKNQSTGLTDEEMGYWAGRIDELCDDIESQLARPMEQYHEDDPQSI